MQVLDHPQTHDRKKQTLLVVTERMTVLLDGEDTAGRYAVVESRTPPGGGVPLLHSHAAQETFYVLAGEYEVYRQDEQGNKQAERATAGTIVHVLADEPHGFLNVGEAEGTMLMIFEPAGVMEPFFADLGIPIEDARAAEAAGPPDMERVMAACARHNIQFHEAPPDPGA